MPTKIKTIKRRKSWPRWARFCTADIQGQMFWEDQPILFPDRIYRTGDGKRSVVDWMDEPVCRRIID